jgi:hypothetical protein
MLQVGATEEERLIARIASSLYQDIVALRPVAIQLLRDNQIYNSRYLVTASQSSMFARQ